MFGAGGLKFSRCAGVAPNPDGVPTRKGTEILRACAVAVTRDMVAEVGPTGLIRQSSVATKKMWSTLAGGV